MRHSVIGFKIRQQRQRIGITQGALAERVGVSISYMNLIENNKRNIGGALLRRIADQLELPVEHFDSAADRRLVHDLVDLSNQPLLEELALTPTAATDFAGQHPRWARALVALNRTLQDRNQAVTALSDRLNQDPFLGASIHSMLTDVAAIRSASEILEEMEELQPAERARFLAIVSQESDRLAEVAHALAGFFDREHTTPRSITPADEVDDFLQEHDNFFPELERAADALRADARLVRGSEVERLTHYLRRKHGVKVMPVPALGANGVSPRARSLYDAQERRMTLVATAPQATRRFELGRLAAHLACGAEIEAALAGSALLHSAAARDRATRALNAYVAAALLLPYEPFFTAVQAARYDIDLLCHQFGASFEQVAHRLLTLKRPGREGVRFGFMRSDPAGYTTKRFPLPYLPLPRHGNACPLWAIYRAFRTPGAIVRDLAEFPDGRRYFFIARSIEKQLPAFGTPAQTVSIMLVCESIHADQLVYGDGLDLSTAAPATPVGPACRLCVRRNCASRQESPVITSPGPEAGAARLPYT